jgi:diguanylate cyclase (GGDEF)-like protein
MALPKDGMENREKLINLYPLLLLPAGIVAVVWAIHGFPVEKINGALIALSIVTVFFSSYLRIQLPRTKIHLTISDSLVILSYLLYGGQVAVLLAVLETAFTSFVLRRQGLTIRARTILLNTVIAGICVFATAMLVNYLFGSVESVVERSDTTILAGLLAVMACTQFLINSVCVSIFVWLKTAKSVWQVWHEYCFNALVMYLSGAILAGLSMVALKQINMFLFAGVIAFFGLVYMTYRRYVDDVKKTSAKAEQAERERAEQAENHIKELQHYVGELEKSSEALRESKEKFRHAAFHDSLTDLPNRNYFIETLGFSLKKTKQNAKFNFAVLFLDLNRFKTINDSLGHSTGDRLILNVAKRLASALREGDLVARFSGDEFAIILNEITSLDEAVEFAEIIKHKLAKPFTLNGRQVFTSVSIGIARGNEHYTEAEDVLRDADIAMYYAKEAGTTYVVFDPAMHTKAVTLLQLETDLRCSIERNEMLAYYQPIIDLATMRLIGFETLMRWNHPQRGIIPPNEFIPVAEETGLIVPLTIWILRKSCNQLVEWQKESPANKGLMMSVNLSGKHFAHPDLVDQIKGVLDETQINPRNVKLELTESAIMENAETAIEMLSEIRELGIQISIDDFGTGYSSLSYLHRFPIDMLKVDRSFVSSMEDGTENGEIVRTVIALAKTLGLSVVAEGIETIHQLHQLRVLGCEYGQGYLFARPVPVDEVEKILADKDRWQNIIPDNNPALLAQNREYSHLRIAK